jgi:hypothetical protein
MLSVPPRLHSFYCPSQDGCRRFFPGFVRLATVFELGHRFGIFVALQLESFARRLHRRRTGR